MKKASTLSNKTTNSPSSPTYRRGPTLHMDHLPHQAPTSARIEIPFVAREYDRQAFGEYGARHGYNNIDDLLKLQKDSPDEFQCVLQTWLYFGLLHQYVGASFQTQDFVTSNGSNRRIINSAALLQHCDRWLAYSPDQRFEELPALNESLTYAAQLSLELDQHLGDSMCVASAVILSVRILIESLSFSCMRGLDSGCSLFLINHMLRDGWCPHRLAGITSVTSSIALYYLSGFPHTSLIGDNHQDCTKSGCRVDQLNDYEPQHHSDCRQTECRLCQAPLEDILAIYEGDDIPVILCTVQPTREVTVKAIPSFQCSGYPGYVAISHVWSDGLGNEEENAIYQCQLIRLVKQVQAVQSSVPSQTKPVAFWLDTMCIPRAEQYRSQRKIAIGRIDWTFARASSVLVRDKVLQGISPCSLPPLQLAAHLHCAKWLTRCWTLAEATLAWPYVIQFSDSASSVAEIDQQFRNNEGSHPKCMRKVVEKMIIINLMYDYDQIRSNQHGKTISTDYNLRRVQKRKSDELYSAWMALIRRSTTRSADVPGILGIVAGVSIKDIIAVREDQRIKAVLKTFDWLPTSLLFRYGTKVQNEPKNRWVPAGIDGSIELRTGYDPGNKFHMRMYDEGRMVGPITSSVYAMYRFQKLDLEGFHLVDTQNQRQFYIQRPETAQSHVFAPEQEWCLVLPNDFTRNGILATIACTAACFTIQKEKGSKLLVTWEFLVKVACSQPRPMSCEVVIGHPVQDKVELYIECG